MFDIQALNIRYKVPTDWKVGPSMTDCYVIALVFEGSLTYMFPDQRTQITAGHFLYMPIHTERTAVANPPQYHKMFSAHFQYKSADLPLPILSLTEPHIIKASNQEYLLQRFSTLHELWNHQLPYHEIHMQAILLEILAIANRDMELHQHAPNKIEMIQVIQDYIKRHYAEKISLNDLALLVDRSPNYMCTLFKEVTGQAPIEYLNQVRIAAARELLLNSTRPLVDIAEAVGFNDQYYFSRMYKKITGTSPKFSSTE